MKKGVTEVSKKIVRVRKVKPGYEKRGFEIMSDMKVEVMVVASNGISCCVIQ